MEVNIAGVKGLTKITKIKKKNEITLLLYQRFVFAGTVHFICMSL